MATLSAFRYTIELQYIKDNKALIIEDKKIKSVITDYNYDEYNMPLIFVNLSIDKQLLDDMINNINNALVNITIWKYVSNNDNEIKSIYLREQCAYFIPHNVNFNKEVDSMDSDRVEQKDLFKVITMGLMKLDHLNANKKSYNGVIRNTTMINAVYSTIQHAPSVLIEPFNYNANITQLILPPINSLSKVLRYYNSIATFYTTPYRFFMDFDCTYLISSKGTPVLKKGEQKDCNTIVFVIRDMNDDGSRVQGMYKDNKQKIYQVDVASNDTSRNVNKYTEKSFNKIKAVTANANIQQTDVQVNNSEYITAKEQPLRIPNENVNLLQNIKAETEMSAITMDINKNDLDSSVFAINKEYLIKCIGVYEDTDGRYLLVRKRELYLREDDTFIMNTMLTLRKINI